MPTIVRRDLGATVASDPADAPVAPAGTGVLGFFSGYAAARSTDGVAGSPARVGDQPVEDDIDVEAHAATDTHTHDDTGEHR